MSSVPIELRLSRFGVFTVLAYNNFTRNHSVRVLVSFSSGGHMAANWRSNWTVLLVDAALGVIGLEKTATCMDSLGYITILRLIVSNGSSALG